MDLETWYGSLSSLNLSHNHLERIQEPYSFDNLGSLDLSFNQFRGKIPTLPAKANSINLASNGFTSIPSDIGKSLSGTQYFSLVNNGVTEVLPESICNASGLHS